MKRDKYLMAVVLPLVTYGCTIVQVEGEGHHITVESPTVTSDNGSTTAYSDRRDPTVNIAPLTTW